MSDLPPESDPITYLADLMQSWLDYAYDALADTPSGQPKDRFIYHGRPPDDCCDYLAIWLDPMTASTTFPIPENGPTSCSNTGRMGRFRMKLVRPCWPVIRDNPQAPFPPASVIQPAAEGLLADAEVLWCAMLDGLSGPAWPGEVTDCLDHRLESMMPDAPRGGCAGWTLTFTAELDRCCP